MTNKEFYIGWMPKAPTSFARTVKKSLFILFPLALITGLLLASFQRKFSTARFEFGKLTEVRGMYCSTPVPMLKVLNDGFAGQPSYTSIPLVGYGKHGAATAIMQLEQETHTSFNGKELTLKGTLLYNDGKILMQVNRDENPVVSVGAENKAVFQQKELGMQTVKGEIVDPKCYFGVMKPGEGKVHRDCAIRCILGGIPPVLKVMNDKGEMNYYLLAGPGGELLNEAVQDYVAEPVEMEARAVQQDDWVILYVKDKSIRRISSISLYKSQSQVASCTTNCIK